MTHCPRVFTWAKLTCDIMTHNIYVIHVWRPQGIFEESSIKSENSERRHRIRNAARPVPGEIRYFSLNTAVLQGNKKSKQTACTRSDLHIRADTLRHVWTGVSGWSRQKDRRVCMLTAHTVFTPHYPVHLFPHLELSVPETVCAGWYMRGEWGKKGWVYLQAD